MKKAFIVIFFIFISSFIFAQDLFINETQIKDGPNVIFIKGTNIDYVSVSIFVSLGENIPGLAHLGEHLIFSTNKYMKSGELDFLLESLGTTCDAYTNYDYSAYKYTVNKKNLNKSLEYLSYALLYNNTSQKEFNIEKQIINDEFSRKKYINFDYIRNTLQKALYGETYYGYPIEGESIEQITLENLKDFYNNNYVSKNFSIILYGDINENETLKIIEKYYVQKDKNAFIIPIKVKENNKTIFINGPKSYYGIMFSLAPSYKLKDAITCDVLSSLFDILSSRIINEKYNYKSTYIHNTGHYASPFSLIYECDDINFVKKAIEDTINNILKGNFTEDDLISAQNAIINDFLSKNNQIDEITYNTGFNYVIYNFETVYSYNKYIRQINNEDIINVSKKYLTKYTSLICEKEK